MWDIWSQLLPGSTCEVDTTSQHSSIRALTTKVIDNYFWQKQPSDETWKIKINLVILKTFSGCKIQLNRVKSFKKKVHRFSQHMGNSSGPNYCAVLFFFKLRLKLVTFSHSYIRVLWLWLWLRIIKLHKCSYIKVLHKCSYIKVFHNY